MWQSIFSKVFGSLTFEGAKALLHQLAAFVAPYAVKEVSFEIGTLLVEGVNAAVTAAVNALDGDKAGAFAHGYVAEIEQDLLSLTKALYEYVPLQIAVETGLKEFGAGSKEANAAIDARNAAVDAIQTDISGLFLQMVKT